LRLRLDSISVGLDLFHYIPPVHKDTVKVKIAIRKYKNEEQNGRPYNMNVFVCLMVFNATFNNISLISLRSGLLVEKTVGQTLSHNVVHLSLIEIQTHNISGDRH